MGRTWKYTKKEEPVKEEPKKEEPKKALPIESPKAAPSVFPPPVVIKGDEASVKALIVKYSPGQPQNVIDGLYSFWDRSREQTKDTKNDPSIIYLLCKAYLLRHAAIVVVVGNESSMLTSCVTGALQNERTLISFDDVGSKAHVDKFEWHFRAHHHPFKDRKSLRGDFKAVGVPADVFIIDARADVLDRVYPEAVLSGLIDTNTAVYLHSKDTKKLCSRLELTLFCSCSNEEGLVRVKLPDGFKLDKSTIDDLEQL